MKNSENAIEIENYNGYWAELGENKTKSLDNDKKKGKNKG